MNKFSFYCRSFGHFIVPLILLSLIGRYTYAETVADFIQNRSIIAEKVDSLDLIKQTQKRNGQPITEIEQLQSVLRDSLQSLRSSIQKCSEMQPNLYLPFHTFVLSKPTNLFDWIIAIVGIIAAFSGFMLLIGLFRAFFTKKSSQKRKPSALKSSSRKQTTTAEPAYPLYTTPSTDASPSNVPPILGKTNLHYLKGRITTEETTDRSEAPFIPKENHQREKPAPFSLNETEQQVIAAARSGLNPAEISRKYQLSNDHVALILRISGKKSS